MKASLDHLRPRQRWLVAVGNEMLRAIGVEMERIEDV
jgi:hypothetical protein